MRKCPNCNTWLSPWTILKTGLTNKPRPVICKKCEKIISEPLTKYSQPVAMVVLALVFFAGSIKRMFFWDPESVTFRNMFRNIVLWFILFLVLAYMFMPLKIMEAKDKNENK